MNTEQFARTCCVTGHRDIAADRVEYVKGELRREVMQAVEDGYTHFISGFSKGTDLLFASIVADLMKENPALTLEAAIPYLSRLNTTDALFHRLLAKCEAVEIHSEEYSPACYLKRNRSMVSRAGRVIAVYDGRSKGGTLFTLRCAYARSREVRVIEL